MFNSFIAQKRTIKLEQLDNSIANEREWKQRYHTEIQPRLLEHYSKRLTSFMRKVAQHPIVLNPEHVKKREEKLPMHFTFKNADDWKSILTFAERREKEENQRIMREKYANVLIDSKTKTKQHSLPINKTYEYRTRQISKEIHPQMRYNNKILQKIESPSYKQKRFSLIDGKKKRKDSGQANARLERQRTSTVSSFSNRHTEEGEETEFNLTKHTGVQNIELQARKYEKQREIYEKKNHFKKLMDLALTAPNDNDKEQIREILRKCGYLKNKKCTGSAERDQIDRFATMVQKTNK